MAKNTPPMGKEKSDKPGDFAKGGSTKMFGPQDASPQPAGVSTPANGRKSPDNKFSIASMSGKTGVMGKQRNAAPAIAGQQSPGGRAGGDTKFGVSGGSGKMFGQQTASAAQPGTSSARNG